MLPLLFEQQLISCSYCAEAKFGNLWTLLAPIIIWCISTTRCTRVYSANKHPLVESIKLIWHTIITTMRAQYERIDGTDDASELMRLNFRKRWCTTPMATTNRMDIQWQYVVPRWLFPTPISWKRAWMRCHAGYWMEVMCMKGWIETHTKV